MLVRKLLWLFVLRCSLRNIWYFYNDVGWLHWVNHECHWIWRYLCVARFIRNKICKWVVLPSLFLRSTLLLWPYGHTDYWTDWCSQWNNRSSSSLLLHSGDRIYPESHRDSKPRRLPCWRVHSRLYMEHAELARNNSDYHIKGLHILVWTFNNVHPFDYWPNAYN